MFLNEIENISWVLDYISPENLYLVDASVSAYKACMWAGPWNGDALKMY